MNEKDRRAPVTRDSIDFPFHEQRGHDGVFAEFDSAGRVIELYYSKHGLVRGPRLSVDYEKRTASTGVVRIFPDPLSNGEESADDAEYPLEEFIRETAQAIASQADHARAIRCAFCNGSRAEVGKLVAGPSVYICYECIDCCADIVATEREFAEMKDQE